jgi:hypothetical protein
MIQLTGFIKTRDTLLAEILPLFKLHARIEHTDEDVLLPRYIGGAIGAAENYLLREVYPTLATWNGDLTMGGDRVPVERAYAYGFYASSSPAFSVRRGRARTLTLVDAAGAIALDRYSVIASADPKTWGFQITPLADLNGITLTAELGFADFASMPDDLQGFILAAAGALYEVRELANYGPAVAQAEFLPTYMLDSWANLTYA